jgi:hypothetical protein
MNDQIDLAVPPSARRTKASTKKRLVLFGLIGFAALMVLVRAVLSFTHEFDVQNKASSEGILYPLVIIAALAIPLSVGLFWSVKIWRLMDEAAQRAHLDAFYWGGSIAWMVIVPFIVLPLRIKGFEFAFITKLDMNTSEVFGLGIFATMIATILGYGIAWLIWWAKRL